MKTIKTFEQFVNESYELNEVSDTPIYIEGTIENVSKPERNTIVVDVLIDGISKRLMFVTDIRFGTNSAINIATGEKFFKPGAQLEITAKKIDKMDLNHILDKAGNKVPAYGIRGFQVKADGKNVTFIDVNQTGPLFCLVPQDVI